MDSWVCAICGMQVPAADLACGCGARQTPPLSRLDQFVQTLRWEIEALQADLERLRSELSELEAEAPALQSRIDDLQSSLSSSER